MVNVYFSGSTVWSNDYINVYVCLECDAISSGMVVVVVWRGGGGGGGGGVRQFYFAILVVEF